MRLVFDVYASFSQVFRKKAEHTSHFLPLGMHVFKNIKACSYGNYVHTNNQ